MMLIAGLPLDFRLSRGAIAKLQKFDLSSEDIEFLERTCNYALWLDQRDKEDLSPTEIKKELGALAKALRNLADVMESTSFRTYDAMSVCAKTSSASEFEAFAEVCETRALLDPYADLHDRVNLVLELAEHSADFELRPGPDVSIAPQNIAELVHAFFMEKKMPVSKYYDGPYFGILEILIGDAVPDSGPESFRRPGLSAIKSFDAELAKHELTK